MKNTMTHALLLAGALLAGAAAAENPATGAPGDWHMHGMGDQRYLMTLLDRFELAAGDNGNNRLWDAQAWYGGDYNKFWVKTEGEGAAGEALESAELQMLFNHLFAPSWSWQAGIRHDVRPSEPDASYAVFGLQGLAPQWFETDVALFVSDDGDVSLRGEFEYDLLLTQRLVLQPRLEINAGATDATELGLARGLHRAEAGVRLRYEITREFAPYVGLRWERLHGDTGDLARAAGEPVSDTSFVIGVRAWF